MTAIDVGIGLVAASAAGPAAVTGAGPGPARPVVLSAHGGSGATTVARALHAPEAARADAGAVIVTALTTAAGAFAVRNRVAGVDAGLPVLVAWTADAPLPPVPDVRAVQRLLADRAVFVTLPYVPAWRYGRPTAGSATPRWLRAIREVAAAARLTAHH